MVEDLIKRIAEQCAGRDRWYVMNEAEDGYCMDFGHQLDADRWMADRLRENPDYIKRNGYHIVKHRSFTPAEALANEAAARLTALESERDALLAAAGKEAVAVDEADLRQAYEEGYRHALPGPYETKMGEAAQRYFNTFKSAHPLPAEFRWSDVYRAMLDGQPFFTAPQAECAPSWHGSHAATPVTTVSVTTQAECAPRDAWQPIDTAPKDGRMFLGWVDAVRYGESDEGVQFETNVSEHDFCRWHEHHGYFENMMGQIGDAYHVTHWQPLPSPPAALSQKAGEQQ